MKRFYVAFSLTALLMLSFSGSALAFSYANGPFVDGQYVGDILPAEIKAASYSDFETSFYGQLVDVTILGGAGDTHINFITYMGDNKHSDPYASSSEFNSSFVPRTIENLVFGELWLQFMHKEKKGYHSFKVANSGVFKDSEMTLKAFQVTGNVTWAGYELQAGDFIIAAEVGIYADAGNFDGDWNDIVFAVRGSRAVPVPAAVWLMGSGLAGLVAVRRKMR